MVALPLTVVTSIALYKRRNYILAPFGAATYLPDGQLLAILRLTT
jgi:hypothetical protein